MKKRGERGDRNHVVISERGETGVGRWGGVGGGEETSFHLLGRFRFLRGEVSRKSLLLYLCSPLL